MLVRILVGTSWSTAQPTGDYEFDAVPQVGHKIVLAQGSGWSAGQVRDVVHRLSDEDGPADVALLVTPLTPSSDQSELPIALLDSLDHPQPAVSVSRSSPWSK